MHLIAIALIGTYAMRDAVVLEPRRLLGFAVISEVLIATALIGITDIPESRSALARFLPNATAVPYRDKKELDTILAAGAPGLDAVIDQAEQGAAWTIRHPGFTPSRA